MPTSTTVSACVTFAVALPLGLLVVRARNLNPLLTQGVAAPVGYALTAIVVVGLLALWVRRDWIVGVAAGGLGAWAGVAVHASLLGTPFGYGSMGGDAGRMSALATYFSTTWVPSDAADPNLPPEYPPLYPMVIGRVAAITGRDAWTLLGPAQAGLIAGAVLASFIVWRRIVPSAVALALCTLVWVGLSEPSKANEVLVLSVFLPLVIGTFATPSGRRPINPVLAGIAFGVMVPLYPNFLVLGLLGIAAVMVVHWFMSPARRSYLVNAIITVGIAAVLASWYLGPLLIAYAGGQTEVVADLFKSSSLAGSQFQLFDSTSRLLFLLQVVGFAGIVVLWRNAWWARPVGLLAGGVLAVKAVMLLRFSLSGHSFMLLYVPYLLKYLFAAAGVLTIVRAAELVRPLVVARLGVPQRLVAVAAVGGLIGVTSCMTYYNSWAVLPAGVKDANGASSRLAAANYAALAHGEYKPSGEQPTYPWPVMSARFPADEVYAAIDGSLGAGATPVVLTADQRVFSFRWFPNYLPPARESSNALTLWDSRNEEVSRLSRIQDPAALAEAMASTPYGPIDVLVLKEDSEQLKWRRLAFSEPALSGPQFVATRRLPGGFAVFVRKQ